MPCSRAQMLEFIPRHFDFKVNILVLFALSIISPPLYYLSITSAWRNSLQRVNECLLNTLTKGWLSC